MTVAPEITSLRNCSDFLIIVDMHIEAKITVAKEHAAQFTSQNDLSTHIKDSFERFMIPCLLEVRKMIEQASEILKDEKVKEESNNAGYAYAILTYFLETKNATLEKIKQKLTDPTVIAGIELVQGIHIDILEEIKPMTHKK